MRALFLALFLVFARTAAAQADAITGSAGEAAAQRGVITGTVSDATTKQPLADVVVTATSPAMQGEQVVVTDASGQYRIPDLPAGNYSLRFERESFQPYSRAGIDLKEGRILRVRVELVPSLLTERIVLMCSGVTIDVGATHTGVNVGADFLRNLPLRP